ncbi:MFS transporter [Desulfonema ishimotonii]|nr:MFS transporter [Desulfonema ishimotonii]
MAVFMMMVGVGMVVARLPHRIIEITGSAGLVGYLSSTFAISYIILQLPVGRLSDRTGFKPLLMTGYLLCALAGILFYAFERADSIFIGRLVQGAGEVPVWALAPALLSVKYPLSKGKAMGIYNAVIHLGLTMGPVLGVMVAEICPGNQIFLLYAGTCLAGALVIGLTVENIRAGEKKTENEVFSKYMPGLVSNNRVLITFAGIVLYGAGYGIFLTVIPAFLICSKHFSPGYTGLYFSLFYIAVSVSQLIVGPLADKAGQRAFMSGGLVIAGAGIGIFSQLDVTACLAALTLASLGLGIFYLSSMAYLNGIVSSDLKGTISGAYYCFWGIGMFFGPLILGHLCDTLSPETGFCILSFAIIFEAVAIFLKHRG